ncbi:MAG: hypothetical protein M1826_004572 [Phylliscum demangeonii]|nr:MAG: hypothetical protein M1826_004572 [Phylliscum demangeonii]
MTNNSKTSEEEADLRMAAAIAAVESDADGEGATLPHFAKNVYPSNLSFGWQYEPFEILDPEPRTYYGNCALHNACHRARMHTGHFVTSSRLTPPPSYQAPPPSYQAPPPSYQAALACHTPAGPDREPAPAFWRGHHRATWNAHAAVGSIEAGLPIPALEGATSAEEAGLGMAAAIAAVESDADGEGAKLLAPYHPPGCNELGDRSEPIPADQHVLPFSEHAAGDRDSDHGLPTLPGVLLGSFRRLLEEPTNERANAVVAVLDRRGRYYRRVVPWSMDGEPLPVDEDFDVNHSCHPARIAYLPRFRDRSESEVMALVRHELALLQAEIDAPAPTGLGAV